MAKSTSIGVRLPDSLKSRLEDLAWQSRIPASRLVRQVIEDYLSKQEEVKKEVVDKDRLEVSF